MVEEEFNLYPSADYQHLANRHVLIDADGRWRVVEDVTNDEPVGTYADLVGSGVYFLHAETAVRKLAPHVTYGRIWRAVCSGVDVTNASCAEYAAIDRSKIPSAFLANKAGLVAPTFYTPWAPRYRPKRV